MAQSDPTNAQLLALARHLALEAGNIALKTWGRSEVHYKADNSVVTDADFAVQRFIRRTLEQIHPEHGFLGEEVSAKPNAGKNRPFTWVVDPIDGTDQYRRGLPNWAVSIGLLRDGEPALGVIYAPSTDQLFWVEKGGRAHLNGREIQVDDGDSLDRTSLILVPSNLHQIATPKTPSKIQAFGSNCLHLVHVARGAAQATVLGMSQVWDYLAAALILEGAGGKLHDIRGDIIDIGAMARNRAYIPAAIACHPNRLPSIFEAFEVDLPREQHAFDMPHSSKPLL